MLQEDVRKSDLACGPIVGEGQGLAEGLLSLDPSTEFGIQTSQPAPEPCILGLCLQPGAKETETVRESISSEVWIPLSKAG